MPNHAHISVNAQLESAAREASGLPPHASLPALVRYALAKLAQWPDSAAASAARIPPADSEAG